MIRRLYDVFGPERLMWATDCPFLPPWDTAIRLAVVGAPVQIPDHLPRRSVISGSTP